MERSNPSKHDHDFASHFATNTASAFQPFELILSNDATLTGIVHVPNTGEWKDSQNKTLLIGIHGATCSAYNWDIDPEHTASTFSDLTGIPFVAFHRPNFLGSGGWLKDGLGNHLQPQPTSYFQEEARWYHDFIFPALWDAFGVSNGCSALVTDSHSMSVPPTIIAAGIYSKQDPARRRYPWAGLVLSGFGDAGTESMNAVIARLPMNVHSPADLPYGFDPALHVPPFLKHEKITFMLGPEECREQQGGLDELCWRQNTPQFIGEAMDLVGFWVRNRDACKAAVNLPVLYGIGSLDFIWKASRRDVEDFVGGFENAPRVEGARIQGAPHAIEWSRHAAAWYMRVFAWAAEVTTSVNEELRSLPDYP